MQASSHRLTQQCQYCDSCQSIYLVCKLFHPTDTVAVQCSAVLLPSGDGIGFPGAELSLFEIYLRLCICVSTGNPLMRGTGDPPQEGTFHFAS